ncbi:hypothetical protein UFOVP275_26 [uncultured Caudovirales phage]|uniref:Uncharacterized protein n=1 Tax=uncultured Caudovirales phage TaxID=2100421 RepID=A0A6J5LND9_9CAUD|nr:hypothetical protein UFOVP275_26 [uncultured Caudovirales phage]
MTRLVQFANNAVSKLAANLSNVGLTITLTPGEGAKFPALSGGQVFYGTIVKVNGYKEVVKVTARATDTLTIVRAVESVAGAQTAYAFTAGDSFELRMTAGSLAGELDRLDAAAFLDVKNKTANYTIVEADVCSLVRFDTTSGNLTATLPLISTLTGSFEIQIQKNTADLNTLTVARSGSDTINGLNSYILSAQYQSVWIVADIIANTWSVLTSASASNRVIDSFTANGTTGPFTLSGNPGTKNNTDVFISGNYTNKALYTLTGNNVSMASNVTNSTLVEIAWTQPLSIGTPADGSVTGAKLSQAVIGGEHARVTNITGTNNLTGNITGVASYAAGQTFRFVANASNTGPVNINISGIGTVNITKAGNTPLEAGDIAAGAAIQVVNDGAQFQLTSGAGGGAKAGGVIYENSRTLTSNYTVSANKGGMMVGPITINTNISLTVPSGLRLVVL